MTGSLFSGSCVCQAFITYTSFNTLPCLGQLLPLAPRTKGLFHSLGEAYESYHLVFHLEERRSPLQLKFALINECCWSPAVEVRAQLGLRGLASLSKASASLIIFKACKTRSFAWAGFNFPWQGGVETFLWVVPLPFSPAACLIISAP